MSVILISYRFVRVYGASLKSAMAPQREVYTVAVHRREAILACCTQLAI